MRFIKPRPNRPHRRVQRPKPASLVMSSPWAEWGGRSAFPAVPQIKLGDPLFSLSTEFVLTAPGTSWKLRVAFDRASSGGSLGPQGGRSTAAWNLLGPSKSKVGSIEEVVEGDLSLASMTWTVCDEARNPLVRLPIGKGPNSRGRFGRAAHDSWLLDADGERLSRLHYATEETPPRQMPHTHPLLLYDPAGAVVARATPHAKLERDSPVPWTLDRVGPLGSLLLPTLHVLITGLLWHHSGYWFLPSDLALHEAEVRGDRGTPLADG